MIKNNYKFIFKLILVLLWLCVIFFFSSSNSDETNNQSLGVTKSLITYTLKTTNYLKVTNIELNDDNINNIIDDLHPIIRKAAHFTEFLILSVLVLLMLKETNLNYNYIFTILFCLLIAILDETHQLFVDGRSAQFVDVIIDTSGSLFYLILNKTYHLIRNK